MGRVRTPGKERGPVPVTGMAVRFLPGRVHCCRPGAARPKGSKPGRAARYSASRAGFKQVPEVRWYRGDLPSVLKTEGFFVIFYVLI